jgi:hypothetical protein
MRPCVMWGIQTPGGLAIQTAGPILIGVMVFEKKDDARRCLEDQGPKQRALGKPVPVFVKALPSLMWRPRQEGDPEGVDFVVGE